MFGSKKTAQDALGTPSPSSPSGTLNSLVKGTTVEGKLVCESDIRIDGIVKGSVYCKAKVIVGATGVVEGDVQCVNAMIEGRVQGTIKVEDTLSVRETAVIHGDVTTGKLAIAAGAIFDVTCRMTGSAANAHLASSTSPSTNGAAKQAAK